jgi:hypothetical protein
MQSLKGFSPKSGNNSVDRVLAEDEEGCDNVKSLRFHLSSDYGPPH